MVNISLQFYHFLIIVWISNHLYYLSEKRRADYPGGQYREAGPFVPLFYLFPNIPYISAGPGVRPAAVLREPGILAAAASSAFRVRL